jgi:hypothetical protein
LPVGAEIIRLINSFNINDLDSPSRKDEEAQLLAGRLAFIFNCRAFATSFERRAWSFRLWVRARRSWLIRS